MGFSGAYLYDGTQWTRQQSGQLPDIAEPWLMVDVHDSAYTTITYRPTGSGSGVAYLGRAPRGADQAADGLVEWWARTHEAAGPSEFDSKKEQIAAYLSTVDNSATVKPGDGGQPDPAETYAELKTARFLVALGLPVPDELVR
ncbi:hypothetical protein DMH04_08860 [Kibdelosporangium aridum]|uniref:Uncharacterized protein n=1 Tax=Kibdelosporangium aridum TaxID=2030 RepID=A0A428ZKU9_KIBAR|nr:hypothetical protein [Kibdelosporangium aridum]RSM88717.1 hypothetical protein DMH04_08860 [Kibdelosporangium aridum]